MKHGDKHIIVSAISDKIELHIEPSIGGDLLLLMIEDREGATSKDPRQLSSCFLNREHGRVLFGHLAAWLHEWEGA